MEHPEWKQTLVRGSAALLRAYYRHVPLNAGKRPVWRNVVQRLLPRARGVTTRATTRFGARMNVRFPDSIQTFVYFFGVWEPAITAYLTGALAPGDVVIDIGANVGYDTLLASHLVGPSGHVHAIEASPHVHRLLAANLALNGTANVTTHHAAVCAAACSVPVFLHDAANLGGSTIVPAVAARRGAPLEAVVPGLPLPAILPDSVILGARLIKLDVEGAEWPVVQGFAHLLPRMSPRTELLIEVSAEAQRDHGTNAQAFLDVFRAAGFSPFAIRNHYGVELYLDRAAPRPEPLTGTEFDQIDILFRRLSRRE